MVDAQLLILAYTIAASLLGLAFFSGRVASTVYSLRDTATNTARSIEQISRRLDALDIKAAKNEEWHNSMKPPKDSAR